MVGAFWVRSLSSVSGPESGPDEEEEDESALP
jgi:hypothetical protein